MKPKYRKITFYKISQNYNFVKLRKIAKTRLSHYYVLSIGSITFEIEQKLWAVPPYLGIKNRFSGNGRQTFFLVSLSLFHYTVLISKTYM